VEEILASEQIGFPILSFLVFMPTVLVAALHLLRGDERLCYNVALAGATAELMLAAVVGLSFLPNVDDVQFVERSASIPGLGASYHLGVDGINVLFVPVTALLALCLVLYAEQTVRTHLRHYLMAIFALETTLMGRFVSLDLLLFCVFMFAELVPSYILITRWGAGRERFRIAREYVALIGAGALFIVVGAVMLAHNFRTEKAAGLATPIPTPTLSFDYPALLDTPVTGSATVIFFLMFIGFAVRAPIFPFHAWLPKVLQQGPVLGLSVFVVGLPIGTYGLLRFVIPLMPDEAARWSPYLAVMGAVAIVYGALLAIEQTNLRSLLAFGNVSHVGVITLGLFALNYESLQGSLLQMVNLGAAGAGLFFVAGFMHERVGSLNLPAVAGMSKYAPVLAGCFLVIGLASVGLPPTNGFNGEHLIALGALEKHWSLAVVVALGTVLTATYLLWYFSRSFLAKGEVVAIEAAPETEKADRRRQRGLIKVTDLGRRELVIAGALASMIFSIGLYTGPFLDAMNGSLRTVEDRIEHPLSSGQDRAWERAARLP
jgi:NADH-quinone oxidoreductase subunit M